MLLTVEKLTLCIFSKILKCFIQLIIDYLEEIFLVECDAVFFYVQYYRFYIILKLRTPRTQNFLKYRNILSGSRDIREKKNQKFLKLRFFWKNLAVLKSS